MANAVCMHQHIDLSCMASCGMHGMHMYKLGAGRWLYKLGAGRCIMCHACGTIEKLPDVSDESMRQGAKLVWIASTTMSDDLRMTISHASQFHMHN